MKQQLMDLVMQNTQDAVVNNTEVPNEYNHDVQQEITESIQSGLTSSLSGGNLDGVMELFTKGAKQESLAGNPVLTNITDQIVGNLGKKFGISPGIASNIAGSVLPGVLNQFSKKVADPSDKSINMNDVIGSLTGGKGSSGIDFNDILGSLIKGKTGGIDLGKIAGELLNPSGGKKKKSGGLLSILKGLFGG